MDVSKAPNHKIIKGTQMLRSPNVLILEDKTSRGPGCFSSISKAIPQATAIDQQNHSSHEETLWHKHIPISILNAVGAVPFLPFTGSIFSLDILCEYIYSAYLFQ